MTEEMRMWLEITFNVGYLIAVWSLVLLMWRHRKRVAPENKMVARYILWAFGLLALGDSGHVGFRVLAYIMGGLEQTLTIGQFGIGLVGLGALATAVTVTLFYVLMLFIWKERYGRAYGWFGQLLLAAGVVRFLIMIPTANQWNSTVPPQPWSLYRNLPLIVLGVGVAFLLLRDAIHTQDRPFLWIGLMIVLSYAFYLPVILFVQQIPIIGMLMIPKTLAYIAIAVIAYRALWRPRRAIQPTFKPRTN